VYDSWESRNPWQRYIKGPLYLDIEPTNICSLNCKFCVGKQMKRPKGKMSLELFEKLCRYAKGFDVKGVRFLRWGEPMLNEDIVAFVTIAKKYGLLTHMTTNGLHLDHRKAHNLAEAGLDSIIVSMQGLTKQEYEKLRGPYYDQMFTGLLMIAEARNQTGPSKPFITVSTTTTDESEEDVTEFVDNMMNIADDVCVGATWFRRLEDKGPVKEFLPRARKLARRFRCQEVMIKLSIDWDGTISPCCLDYDRQLSIGTFPEMGLKEAWNHRDTLAIRDLLTNKRQDLFTLCSTCELNYEFRGRE